jgi:hypothetical protein
MHRGQLTHKTLVARPLQIVLLVLNAIGAIVYVYRASPSWRIPEEHGLVPITGEPLVWFAGILPVVAVCFVLNLTWGILVLVRRQWQNGSLWLLAALCWLVAIWVDFAHH